MKRIVPLALSALVGALIALVAVLRSHGAEAPPVVDTPAPPFASYVAGGGVTETVRGNVAIGTAVAGVVRVVHVQVGDLVTEGQPLFEIEGRDLAARLPVAQAQLAQAEAASAKPRHRLEFLLRLKGADRAAISQEAVSSARDDASSASAAVDSARAEVAQLRTDIDRLVVRAPTAGKVLQVSVRPGQFAQGGGAQAPLLLVGDDARMYLRVDIDENDAWRVRPGARAIAVARGNSQLRIVLRFEYIEPFVTGKSALTGQSTERTDQRVLQVVYSFAHGTLPVYLGQRMDAFIETAPNAPIKTGAQLPALQ
ncbi:MAG: HlyD family efflux transporter periplasmic adaptor subunit [Pseudoxanthomonas sp.]